MGSISVAIELRDDFTNMLYQMAESVNFRISDSGSLPSLPTVDVRIHPVLPDPVIPQQAPVRIPVQWQSGVRRSSAAAEWNGIGRKSRVQMRCSLG